MAGPEGINTLPIIPIQLTQILLSLMTKFLNVLVTSSVKYLSVSLIVFSEPFISLGVTKRYLSSSSEKEVLFFVDGVLPVIIRPISDSLYFISYLA